MTEAQIRTIKCTSCGAPLSLHGGHKIRSLNCEYCGAVMDAWRDYKTLAQFSDQIKPLCPFEIGMQGTIKDVKFTIVGMIGWYAEGDHWVDLMLYSPTHGYAWLSYENAHVVFTRRVRDLPTSSVWQLTTGRTIMMSGRQYKVFDQYTAEITYVAGELTWIAHLGDTTHLLDAIDPPWMLTAEKGLTESEYYLSEYMDQDAMFESFGAPRPPARGSYIHPAAPYRSRFLQAASQAAKPFAMLVAAIVVIIWLFFRGSEVYSEKLSPADLLSGKQTAEFTINKPGRLVKLELSTNLSNAWVFLDIAVKHNNKVVYALGKNISYYAGRDSDGSWSEGSTKAKATFKAPEAGKYSLEIQAAEGGVGESSTRMPQTQLDVRVKQGYVSPFYFILLLVLVLIALLAHTIGKILFEGKRWKPVTGGDD